MDQVDQPWQHRDNVHDGQRRGVDLVVVVQVLVLGQVAKGLAEGYVADGVERKELRLLGKVHRPRVVLCGDVLAIYEAEEVEELAVQAGFEAEAFILLARELRRA